jgi:hypothetical protein
VQPLIIARLLFLLTVANGAPVIARDILGKRFSFPLDGGARFIDGYPLFGPSKTIRGILLSVAATSACAALLEMHWNIGFLVGCTAMAGDLFSSFLKRRLRLPSGTRATGLDQMPESVLPLLACWKALSLTIPGMAAIAVLFLIGEIILSPLLFKIHLRDRPY